MHILTTRFNIKTLQENVEWKKKKKITTCAYGLSKKLPETISIGSYVYVIEMINDKENISLGKNKKNKYKKGMIAGIGYLKNRYFPHNRSRIYDDQNYNRYVYIGDKYISREDIIKKMGDNIINFLEKILFTGTRHYKRGRGMTTLSFDRIMVHDYIREKKDICKTCGLLKDENHDCAGYRVTPVIKNKNICPFCYKPKKTKGGLSHICNTFKRDEEQLKKVLLFFRNLFN